MVKVLRAWAETHPGAVRPTNQDCFGLPGFQSQSARDSCQLEINVERGWALVSDGMGGHRAGAYASKVAVEFISERLPALQNSADLLGLLTLANHHIHEAMLSGEGEPGMGATIVGLWFDIDSVSIFNVGDSRAYILRRGEISQISLDHTPESGSQTERRSHRLTQSLGGTFHRLDPIPHIASVPIGQVDSILLCTDGLTDLVNEKQILSILEREDGNPAQNLVNAALSAGGRDNITVIFLRLSQ